MVEMIYLFLIGGLVAGFSIMIIWLILSYIRPAMLSPGWIFIKAKKNSLPVIALEDGGHWRFILGKTPYNGAGYIVDTKTDDVITVTPQSLKYGRGVLMGVGESFKSILVHPSLLKVIAKAIKENWKPEDIRTAIEAAEQQMTGNDEDEEKEEKNVVGTSGKEEGPKGSGEK